MPSSASGPKPVSQKKQSRRIEVFRPGTFTAMSGASFTATAEELADLVERYDPENNPIPVVVGHPRTDAPAYGWVEGFSYDEDADRLVADIGELEPQFDTAVSEGRYKKISMSFHMPGATSNPAGDALYPKHIGFLGAAAPAVPGLKPVSFSGNADETITIEFSEFADRAFKDVASLFRKFREWLIAEKDLETADQVVPDFYIRWLDEAGDVTPETGLPDPAFSEPEKDETMAKAPKLKTPTSTSSEQPSGSEASFAEREANLVAREAELAEREAEARRAGHEAFAEELINDGRLATGSKDKVVALLDTLSSGDLEDVSFADGGTETTTNAVDLAKSILKSQGKIVEFGETDLGDEPNSDTLDAASIAAEAQAFQASQNAIGIEVSISDAVTHVEQKHGITS